ncbi:MAG: BamA/TamA family outer membrane protein [Halanaerobiales bacterium]|nr:BamA/TamA family outer membrane protein [Halanaerobiales bacterium]
MKRRYLIMMLTVFLFVCLITVPLSAQSQDQVIKAIEIKGNDNLMSNEIISVIETEVGDRFNSDQVRDDMQTIYDLGYFQDITVNFQNFEGGLKVIFNVVENPIIEGINIEGIEVYDRAQVIEWLGVKSGSLLNVKKLNEGLENVTKKYQDDGYVVVNFADVNISDKGILNIVLEVGHVNDIKVEGNEKTKDYVILREVDIKKGQIVNINDIRAASRKIFNLDYFTDINPELQRVSEDNNDVNIVIKLQEKKTGNFNFGGGYSSREGWFGFVKVNESNLGGNGQTLSFNYQFGKNSYYNLSFSEPYLMNFNTSFAINLYNRNEEGEDFDTNQKYKTDTTGGTVSIGHDLFFDWHGTAQYKLENISTNYLDEEIADTTNELRSVTLKIAKNTTNYLVNPTKGKNDSFSIEHAGYFLGGDDYFTKYNFEFRRYYPGFKGDQSWALRLKGGTSTGELPPYEKYKLGGADTLRGYELNSFSGDKTLLTQVEYRIPFLDNLTGVIFVDGGQTWDKAEEVKLEDLQYGKGLGVRLNTPIGQIRLDYGWDDQEQGMTHFSLGNTF